MGFKRRLVPQKRFMRYKMRTVLEKGVGIIETNHLAGENDLLPIKETVNRIIVCLAF